MHFQLLAPTPTQQVQVGGEYIAPVLVRCISLPVCRLCSVGFLFWVRKCFVVNFEEIYVNSIKNR